MAKKVKKLKTVIIIATVEEGDKGSFASMFLRAPQGKLPANFKLADIVELDKPLIISPKGFKGLEIFSITEDIVIHGKGIQRRIKKQR